jgi:hypothetical protein
MSLDIEEFAARWILATIPASELPEVAGIALTVGHDGPALRELAGELDPSRSEVSSLVERALRELGAPQLTRADAAVVLAARVAARIVDGSVEPYDGAKQIWCLGRDVPEVGHALDPFIYWASEFEDATDDARLQFCTQAILASARSLGGHSA